MAEQKVNEYGDGLSGAGAHSFMPNRHDDFQQRLKIGSLQAALAAIDRRIEELERKLMGKTAEQELIARLAGLLQAASAWMDDWHQGYVAACWNALEAARAVVPEDDWPDAVDVITENDHGRRWAEVRRELGLPDSE